MSENIFSKCHIYILPNGLLTKRIKLFEEQIKKNGGKIVTDPHVTHPTHIVIEDNISLKQMQVVNALKSVKLSTNIDCEIVGTLWLSRCLKEKKRLDTENFKFKTEPCTTNGPAKKNESCDTPVKKQKLESLCIALQGNSKDAPFSENNIQNISNRSKNSNRIIINEFKKLADAYRARGDRWRTLAYDRAVISLETYQQEITHANDVKNLPYISAKILDKISEILDEGYLSKVQDVCNDEQTKILETFAKVWGAGSITAQMWYQQGFRTLEDLETKGNLTNPQKLGLKYYYDIQERIPRQEVEEIIQIVNNAALEIESSLQVLPCGSFRRGKETCGDIDVLLIRKNSIKYQNVLSKILNKLKSTGFLIDNLSGSENNDNGSKYLGLCKLPKENSKNRRLDIFVVAEQEAATAIMHYTGSALFNRGIRLHAQRMNMQLSENALLANVSQGKDVTRGYPLPTPNEEAIFKYLGLEYRPPENREIFVDH